MGFFGNADRADVPTLSSSAVQQITAFGGRGKALITGRYREEREKKMRE